jgi:protein-L-isoaspartate O-methyltransferase
MSKVIQKLIDKKVLVSKPIIEAFQRVNRADFVPREVERQAETDTILPISYGGYLPRFTTAAQLIEELNPQPKNLILHVGAGSGWISAILSFLVGKEGKVIAFDPVSKLCEIAQKDLSKYSFTKNIEIFPGKVEEIIASRIFDRILLTSETYNHLKNFFLKTLHPQGIFVSLEKEKVYCFKNNEKKFIPLIK